MKKLFCIILVLIVCACASAQAAEFLLPIGLPFGATVEDVTVVDSSLSEIDLGSKVIYVGYSPSELFGCGLESHNYIFDENGGLIYYVCGILPEYFTAFEEALKEHYSELKHISADGMLLNYTTTTGELGEEIWIPAENTINQYAADGFDTKAISQYLLDTDEGYVAIFLEDVSMGEGAEYFEFCACYFTLMDASACEALAADSKIAD